MQVLSLVIVQVLCLLRQCCAAALSETRNSHATVAQESLKGRNMEDPFHPQFKALGASGDPLVDFLRNLKLHLPDVTDTKVGVTFDVTDLTCSGLSITRIASELHESNSAPFIAATLHGLGVVCTGNFAYHGLAIISGSGSLRAEVTPSDDSTAYGALAFPLNVREPRVANRALFSRCGANIDFELTFSNTILSWILDALTALLKGYIKETAVSQVCQQLSDLAAHNLTQAVRDFNKLLLPPDFTTMAAELEQPSQETIDWTKVGALEWSNWFLSDVLGTDGMQTAIRWALKDGKTAHIPGPESPLVSKIVQQGDTGLVLNVTVRLLDVEVAGADSVQEMLPFKAASPSELEVGARFGTDAEPALEVATRVAVDIKALDPEGLVPESLVEEVVELKLGLQKPSIGARMKVLVSEAQIKQPKSLAQLFFVPGPCARSALTAAPVLNALSVSFTDLSTPLTFKADTSGQLEADMAKLLNENIGLFNFVYQKHLPAAISRIAASDRVLRTVNANLAEKMGPSTCIDEAEAKKKADELPKYFHDWSSFLNGTARSWVDNIVDGLLKHNTTVVNKGLAQMPPVVVEAFSNDKFKLEETISLNLTSGALAGLDQVKALRVFVPTSADSQFLTSRMAIQCPSNTSMWQPEVSLTGEVDAKPTTARVEGSVSATPPCGEWEATTKAVVDVHELMALRFPMPDPACALRAFAELKFVSNGTPHYTDWSGAKLVVVGAAGPGHDVLREFCHHYPGACTLMKLAGSSFLSESTINLLIATKRAELADRCGYALEGATSADDAGETAKNAIIVVSGIMVTFGIVIGISAFSRKGRSLSARSWQPQRPASTVAVVGWSLVLSAALWLRLVSLFYFQVAGVDAAVHVASLGGEVANIPLITFDFFGLVEHFWTSGAWICSIALMIDCVDAFIVLAMLLTLWLTPMFQKYQGIIIRMLLVVVRWPLIDIVFFSLAMPTLNHDVDMLLGVQVQLRNHLKAGVYLGITSVALKTLFLLYLEKLVDDEPRVVPPSSRNLKVISGVQGGLLMLGMVMWMLGKFLHVETTEVAGAFIPTGSFSLADVIGSAASGDSFLGVCLVVTCVVAPLFQAFAALAVALRPKAVGESSLLDKVAVGMGSYGDAFAAMDVFFLGFFMAFVPEINGFVKWIARDQFEAVCDLFEFVVHSDCIGTDTSVMWLGGCGLLLVVITSVSLILWHAYVEIMYQYTVVRGREACEGDCSAAACQTPAERLVDVAAG